MSSNNRIYHAFTTKYDGLSDKLINDVYVDFEGNISLCSALWDTGATGSCISKEIATDMGLVPTGMMTIRTPSGAKNVSTYLVDIVLPNDSGGVRIKDVVVCGTEIGAQGISVLIGMDVITIGDFAVSNFDGKTVFTYRIPSQATTDYVTAIQSRTPLVKAKKPGRNDPCPCGSGKKYKNCCGRNTK